MREKLLLLLIGFITLNIILAETCFAKIVNPNVVYTYAQMDQDLKTMERKYGNSLQVTSIGKSHLGKEIWAAKLGKGNRNILLIGAHHGREWLTTSLLMVMLENYVRSYDKGEQIGCFSTNLFDEVAIWFIPMLNPDGVTIQQKGLTAVPKYMADDIFEMNALSPDFSRWKANGIGIDLNRQYPAGWSALKEVSVPWYQFHKGPAPMVAKEIVTITAFTKNINPSVALSYHSSGREIFWNYKNGSYLERDKYLANKVSLLTGYTLSKPIKEATGGGFTDWFITTFHKPGMTIEICPLIDEISPPLSIFKEEWKRNELVGIMLADEVQKMKLSN
ncbi:carboxypeptidase [Bacillus sp. DNRA2]|uniref:M14 family zinc carboxypeptidase n=1 Tax=Bacillus sp. DNRA2 TaxID=2723053 RepID=UPI00145D30A3|nr:M14 family zinc carboxypeptidase [Bacillus sp. DNRA2]NMD72008.1 carboxypeptidase [Bacillus sp. DNRA2]